MPAQAALTAAIAGGASITGFALAASLVIAGAIDAYLIGALFGPDDIDQDLGKQNLNVKTASGSHKIVYGRNMVGGTVLYIDVLDRYYLEERFPDADPPRYWEKRDAGAYLGMVLALAAHPIDGVEEVWIGEDRVFEWNYETSQLVLTNYKFQNYVEAVVADGTQTTANPFLLANIDKQHSGQNCTAATQLEYYRPIGAVIVDGNKDITISSEARWTTNSPITYAGRRWTGGKEEGEYIEYSGTLTGFVDIDYKSGGGRAVPAEGKGWTSSHICYNTAYLFIRFRFNPDLFNGIPKVRTVLRGKKVYDPRWDTQYLTHTILGEWTRNTSYSVNDVITWTPTGQQFVCETAHTSNNSLTDDECFTADFVIQGYWQPRNISNDPDTWAWSDNWALCVRDYLTSGNYYDVEANSGYTKPVTLYGIGVTQNEIDEANVIEAANISDEVVYLQPSSISVVSNDYNGNLSTLTLGLTGDQTDYYNLGSNIQINSTLLWRAITLFGFTFGGGYDLGGSSYSVTKKKFEILKSYYDSGSNETKLVVKSVQAIAATTAQLWDNRFTINGIVDTEQKPIDIIERLAGAGAAKIPYVQGKFRLVPGVYITPTITIDESNLSGPIEVKGSLPLSEKVNTVSGTFKSPADLWEQINFGTQTSSVYITEDGYELVKEVKYPFTISNFAAQRLARIALQRSREGVSCILRCNLSAMEISVGQFIYVSLERLGWTNKVFSVVAWTYESNQIILQLREENSAAYDWVSSTLVPITYAPDTDFDISPNLDPITDFTASSGTEELIQLADGTIVPRLKLTWTAPEQDLNTYLNLEMQVKPVDIDNDNTIVKNIRLNEYELDEYYPDYNFKEGDTISIKATIRYDDPNVLIKSDPTFIDSHTIVGKTEPPADVTGFTHTVTEDTLVLSWNINTEIDFKQYEIRVGGSDWDTATFLINKLSSQHIVVAPPTGSTVYRIKAVDTTGNYSTNAVTTTTVLAAPSAPANLTHTIQQDTIVLAWPESSQGAFKVFDY